MGRRYEKMDNVGDLALVSFHDNPGKKRPFLISGHKYYSQHGRDYSLDMTCRECEELGWPLEYNEGGQVADEDGFIAFDEYYLTFGYKVVEDG